MPVARYDRIGVTYAARRQPDPRLAERINRALGDARTVLNVGAGAGSYEPTDRAVVAVEPSTVMLHQRDGAAAPAVQAVAEALPFREQSFDATLAVLTVHHWSDLHAGLREMQRVAARQVVLTWDPQVTARYWLVDEYLPEIAELDRDWDPIDSVLARLPVESVEVLPVPADCRDGFLAAYWRRPDAYLDPIVQAGISGLQMIDPAALAAGMTRLARDLASGAWAERHGDLLRQSEFDGGYRLVTAGHRANP